MGETRDTTPAEMAKINAEAHEAKARAWYGDAQRALAMHEHAKLQAQVWRDAHRTLSQAPVHVQFENITLGDGDPA